jgi:hypothetical protein
MKSSLCTVIAVTVYVRPLSIYKINKYVGKIYSFDTSSAEWTLDFWKWTISEFIQ